MPQALTSLCLIHFWNWQISPFSLLALWGNKKWSPSMKVQQMENSKKKMASKGCNYSSSIALGTQTPLSHLLLELACSLFSLLVLWGNKNWPPSIKVKEIKNFPNKSGAKGCKWSSLKAPGTENPLSHPFLELAKLPFLTISPLG